MRSLIVVFFVFVFTSYAYSQLILDTLGWISPVDIPITLSGNFAELRSGHFHAGIDIKTQGKEGLKIYAVQKGYIARIKISSGGYGKAIYINHPDGYTSVYAHLKTFPIQLEKFIRNKHYELESFEIDLSIKPGELPVEQGDIIGLSGNSGSSSGPHLHFEIRDTKLSQPLNGLFLGYDIKDQIAPKLYYLYVYPQTNTSHVTGNSKNHYYSLTQKNGRYSLRQGDTLLASGKIGLGLKVDDYLDGAANRCGVYQLKLILNEMPYLTMQFDGVSFSETRYINSVMDYAENVAKNRKIYRLFKEPNNQLSVYLAEKNNGIIQIEPGELHAIRIETTDAYLNKSELRFYLKGANELAPLIKDNHIEIAVPWQHPFAFDSLGLTLIFPQQALYDSLFMDFSVTYEDKINHFSPVYQIHNESTPIHKFFALSIKYDSIDSAYTDKLFIAKVNGTKYVNRGGIAGNGIITTKLREFGNYVVAIDTVAPEIKPLGILSNSFDLTNSKAVSFRITDDLSGVSKCNGYIDNKWVLFDWDAKNDLFFYEFDEYIPFEGTFELKIEAIDERGNRKEWVMHCTRNII